MVPAFKTLLDDVNSDLKKNGWEVYVSALATTDLYYNISIGKYSDTVKFVKW